MYKIFVSLTLLLISCGGGGKGSDGANGSNGLTSLIAVTDEAAGANCAAGGKKIVTGLDKNSDGTLGSDEITETSYVCSGAAGTNGTTGTATSSGFSVYDSNNSKIGTYLATSGTTVWMKLTDSEILAINAIDGSIVTSGFAPRCYFASSDCSGQCMISTISIGSIAVVGSSYFKPSGSNLGTFNFGSYYLASSCSSISNSISISYLATAYTPVITLPVSVPITIK